MSQHTLGPWHRNIPPAKHYPTIFAGRNKHVAHLAVHGISDEEAEANANLIAAATELFSASKSARLVLEAMAAIDGKLEPQEQAALNELVAAIAKVEGGVA